MDGGYSRHDQLETILHDSNSEPQELSLAYLKKITNEFADELLLGEGGFGKVYKGVLQNGIIVAVKKLFQLKPGLQAKQFENEVYHLMRLKHPNIVRFVGYCYETQNECVEFNGQFLFAEKQQRLLCLEYLSNGSLDGHLSDESSGLDWGTRYKIMKGICCGIHYLHEGCKYQINGSIIHLDLKPANILLDDNMVPKIADFGLSRLFHGTKTETCTTNLAGTLGYMAPEYIYRHVITTKADIYSLGVIIIEIITGDKSDPFSLNSNSSEDFVESVLQKWRNRLKHAPLETDCNQIKMCLEIGLKCFKVDRNERPTTKEIMDSLNGWERRNLVDKHELENTNSVDNKGDALPVPDPAADKVLSLSRGREGGRGVAAILSEALFDQMLLHRNDESCQASCFYTYDAFVAAAGAFPGFGTTGDLDTQKREIAAFLAQTSHETSGGWLTAPDGPYSWGYCYKEEVNPHSDFCLPDDLYPGAPGKKYHGRGPIQLCSNYNYGAAGQAIGVDLLNNPDLVATDATISFKTAIWFWMTPQPPKPSYHAVMTGQWSPSSANKVAGREPGYSGGLECCHGRNAAIDDQIGFFKRYCNIIGISYGTNLDCSDQLMPFRGVLITQPDRHAALLSRAAEHSNVVVLEFLLQKLSSQNLQDQRGAAGMFRLLAKHSAENRACIGDAGVIPILVSMLSTIDVSTQVHVVTALLNLSIYDENKARIVSSGAVPGIVHVLKRGSMEARENSAATLFSLSTKDENKVTIGASGAIPALVRLVSNGSQQGKKDAAVALFQLCIYKGNKGKAVRAGLVPILLELLMETEGGFEDEALPILAILAGHPEGNAAIGAASAIPVLVGIIRNGSTMNKENAAAVMVKLCNGQGEQQQQHLAEAQEQGIVSLLEELAKSGTDRGKRKAVQLLELMRPWHRLMRKHKRSLRSWFAQVHTDMQAEQSLLPTSSDISDR